MAIATRASVAQQETGFQPSKVGLPKEGPKTRPYYDYLEVVGTDEEKQRDRPILAAGET